jgi:hypothetical protein
MRALEIRKSRLQILRKPQNTKNEKHPTLCCTVFAPARASLDTANSAPVPNLAQNTKNAFQ